MELQSLMQFSNGTHTHTNTECVFMGGRTWVSCFVLCHACSGSGLRRTCTHTQSVCSQKAERGFHSVSSSVMRVQDPDLSEPRFTACKARVTVPISQSCCEAFPKAAQTVPGPPVAQNGSLRKDCAFRLSADWNWSARTQDGRQAL